jgi:mono/diheme cytochrome c family protein
MAAMSMVAGSFGTIALRAAAQDVSRDQEARQLMTNRCGICHSTDLVVQQRLDRSHWTATVDKMIRWGASLSPEERDRLVGYLAAQDRPDAPAGAKPEGAK